MRGLSLLDNYSLALYTFGSDLLKPAVVYFPPTGDCWLRRVIREKASLNVANQLWSLLHASVHRPTQLLLYIHVEAPCLFG